MFSTFADVFGSDENETKKINGSNNPFESTSTDTNVDPFGISTDMKLSASSQRFDDAPFCVEPTTKSEETPLTFDPLDKLSTLSINNNITHSKSINLINPFVIPTIANETPTAPIEASPIDLLFDLNVDPSALPTNSLASSDQVQSFYDLLGLNKTSNSSSVKTTTEPTVKVVKSDSLTDIPKSNHAKKSSITSSSTLSAKANIPVATSLHSIPTNVPPTSPSTLRVQATALSILTGGTTSTTPYDDQFLDWLTQSDDLMCGVDPKISGLSKKIDINVLKSTEDLLGSIYKQPVPTLTTVDEQSHEVVNPPPSAAAPVVARRLSDEEIPSICIHEPTSEHNDSNVVPQGYFDTNKTTTITTANDNNNNNNRKHKEDKNDSDDSDNEKMVFKIGAKTSANGSYDSNIPVPLLPPPPSPSRSKDASDEASSSSDDDNDDPLAVFRTKQSAEQKHGENLFADWEEQTNDEEQRVKLMLSCSLVNIVEKWFVSNILICIQKTNEIFLFLRKILFVQQSQLSIIICTSLISMIVHH